MLRYGHQHDQTKLFNIKRGDGQSTIACVILYTDFRFYPLAECARDSFSHFHPDVDIFLVGPDQLPFFQRSLIRYVSGESWGIGPVKYSIAMDLMSSGDR